MVQGLGDFFFLQQYIEVTLIIIIIFLIKQKSILVSLRECRVSREQFHPLYKLFYRLRDVSFKLVYREAPSSIILEPAENCSLQVLLLIYSYNYLIANINSSVNINYNYAIQQSLQHTSFPSMVLLS